MVIRPIGVEGAGLLASIHKEAFEDNGEIWDEASLKQLLSLPGVTALIAIRDDEPLGFLLVRTVLDESEILTFAVRKSKHRQGIGCELFRYFLNLIHLMVRFIYLEVSVVNKGAIAFYEKLNFLEVGRRPEYYRDGSEAIMMRYSL